MTRRKALDESRETRDICAALEHSPHLVSVRQSGTSHRVYTGPRGSVAVSVHGKDQPLGTWHAIIRQATMAGLFALAVFLVIALAATLA